MILFLGIFTGSLLIFIGIELIIEDNIENYRRALKWDLINKDIIP